MRLVPDGLAPKGVDLHEGLIAGFVQINKITDTGEQSHKPREKCAVFRHVHGWCMGSGDQLLPVGKRGKDGARGAMKGCKVCARVSRIHGGGKGINAAGDTDRPWLQRFLTRPTPRVDARGG